MTNKTKVSSLDWRVLFGISVTAVWIFAGLTYLIGIVGLLDFVQLPTGEIGSFLEGAFAPLAFLWLVIGHFMQQSEISANTKAMQSQEKSTARQELHSRRNGYFKLLSLVQEQLGTIAGFHYVSVCGETGTGEVSTEEYTTLRDRSSSGDPVLFVRSMVSLSLRHRENSAMMKEVYFGTEIRTRHSNNFRSTFAKLLQAAKDVDHDDMVVNALLYGSPSGMLFRIIRAVEREETIDTITGFATVQGSTAQ